VGTAEVAERTQSTRRDTRLSASICEARPAQETVKVVRSVGPLELREITEGIIGAAIEVHRELGPGLLESAYEACLAYELSRRGFDVLRQVPLPLVYKEVRLDAAYKVDLLVERSVIIEVKAVDKLDPIHEAQLLSYLRLSGCHVGLLINFNVRVLKEGIKRMVHRLPER
jgi:GxxExxY protein